jgi:hypothetical protein
MTKHSFFFPLFRCTKHLRLGAGQNSPRSVVHERVGDIRHRLFKGEKINNSFYRVPIKPNFSSLFIYASLPFATEFCNIGIIDFIEFRKWLKKGSFVQQHYACG